MERGTLALVERGTRPDVLWNAVIVDVMKRALGSTEEEDPTTGEVRGQEKGHYFQWISALKNLSRKRCCFSWLYHFRATRL